MHQPNIYILLAIFATMLAGCSKSQETPGAASTGPLDGRWAMIRVQDKSTGSDIVPPAGSSNQVYLDFRKETFSGKTMRNTISEGSFTMPDNESITFGTFKSTFVAENEWGGAFSTMLSSCMLQSLYPCRPSKISWQSPRRIEINTAMRYVITFEKI